MNSQDFGQMIAKLRKKNSLTQNELAKRLNVTDKAVSKWESGAGFPEITQLPNLSEIFGVSVDYMLKGSTKGITIAGNMLVDILNIISNYPEKKMLVDVYDISKAVGGCVPNTAVQLAKIDPELFISAIGKVGNDDNGKYILSELGKHGIDVSGIKITADDPTSFTTVMSEKETGDRTFFHARGANKSFSIEDIDIDSLECEIFHIGYAMLLDSLDGSDPEYGSKMARLLSRVRQKNIKTSIDAVSSENKNYSEVLKMSLKYATYVIINETEAEMISHVKVRDEAGLLDTDGVKKAMKIISDAGVEEKVIVHAAEAGFILNKNGEFTVVPSLILPKGYIKGSTGAGDAFAAGCLYGLYSDFDDKHILEFASGASALNLSEADSVSGMKSKKEIEKLIKKYDRRELKK